MLQKTEISQLRPDIGSLSSYADLNYTYGMVSFCSVPSLAVQELRFVLWNAVIRTSAATLGQNLRLHNDVILKRVQSG